MKTILLAVVMSTLLELSPALANTMASSWSFIDSSSRIIITASSNVELMTDELSLDDFMTAQNGDAGEQTVSEVKSEEASSNSLRRPLRFEFQTREGRMIEGLSLDDLQINQACALLGARDDLEVLETLAKCIKPVAIGNYMVSGVPEVVASSNLVRFVIPVEVNRYKSVHLEASMSDGSTIPVNCSPQVSLISENGFTNVFPMIENLSEDRRTLRYKVELSDYLTVSSSSFRIVTSGSSGCRLPEAVLGLEQGKLLGAATIDESGASFSAQFVPSDPALLIVLSKGTAAIADGRLGREWRKQASAIIEASFEGARQNFSQVIVAGYTDASEYAVFIKVPKTQFREQLKRIKNDNDFGFKIDKVGEGLDSSLQVDLEQQMLEFASQGVSVLTVIYGRQQPEGSLCDLGSLANNQFLERLGKSLIIDVLPTKAYNSALKSVRENEKTSGAALVALESENFSIIDCAKYAGLTESLEFSRISNAFAIPLLRADEDFSADYLELSRKWIGGLLETTP